MRTYIYVANENNRQTTYKKKTGAGGKTILQIFQRATYTHTHIFGIYIMFKFIVAMIHTRIYSYYLEHIVHNREIKYMKKKWSQKLMCKLNPLELNDLRKEKKRKINNRETEIFILFFLPLLISSLRLVLYLRMVIHHFLARTMCITYVRYANSEYLYASFLFMYHFTFHFFMHILLHSFMP